MLWRVMVPKDQQPYAISNRGMSKDWVAPVEHPFPYDWAKKNWSEQVKKWEDWVKDKKPIPGVISLTKARFSLVEHSWMGKKFMLGDYLLGSGICS